MVILQSAVLPYLQHVIIACLVICDRGIRSGGMMSLVVGFHRVGGVIWWSCWGVTRLNLFFPHNSTATISFPTFRNSQTAIMGYTDTDKLAINTIRLLAVGRTPLALIPRPFLPLHLSSLLQCASAKDPELC
jgi:hypothetical protein